MVFGVAVLNRPIVAASVVENYEKLLNILNLELIRANVSGCLLPFIYLFKM